MFMGLYYFNITIFVKCERLRTDQNIEQLEDMDTMAIPGHVEGNTRTFCRKDENAIIF